MQLLTFSFGNHIQEGHEVTEVTSSELNVLTFITDSYCLRYRIFIVEMRGKPVQQSLKIKDNMLALRDMTNGWLQGSLLHWVLFKVLNYDLEDDMLNSAHRCSIQAALELLD